MQPDRLCVSEEPAICERCGGFAPLYASWDRAICEPCFEYRHPAERDPFTLEFLLRNTFTLAQQLGLRALLLLLAAVAIERAVTLGIQSGVDVSTITVFISTAVNAVFGGVAEGVVVMLALGAVIGRRPLDWRAAIATVRRRVGKLVVLQLMLGFAFIIGLACCILPGAYILGVYSLAVPVLLREGAGIRQALQISRARLARRWGGVLVIQLAFMLAIALLSWAPRLLQSAAPGVAALGLLASVGGTVLAVLGQGVWSLLSASLSVVVYVKRPPAMRIVTDAPAGGDRALFAPADER